jgi:hypothetical protein
VKIHSTLILKGKEIGPSGKMSGTIIEVIRKSNNGSDQFRLRLISDIDKVIYWDSVCNYYRNIDVAAIIYNNKSSVKVMINLYCGHIISNRNTLIWPMECVHSKPKLIRDYGCYFEFISC